jgi:hypothetical protein
MEVESYDVIVELMSQSHNFGESIADKVELWISVSFALIASAYFAPDRMGPIVASFLVVLYIAFTAHTFANTDADVRASQAALRDASRIAEEREIHLELLELRASDDPSSTKGSPIASNIFVFGLFLGVLTFVGYTSFRTWKEGTKT